MKRLKTFRILLLTYFQINIMASLAFGIGLLLIAVAAILCFEMPEKLLGPDNILGMVLFLFGLIQILMVSGSNLRRVIITNTGALFPRYRQMHLRVFCLIMVVALLLPITVITIQGEAILPVLALFLFVSAIFLWGLFNFGENGLIMIFILWLTKIMYDMLGYPSRFIPVPGLFDVSLFGSREVFHILVILVSLFFLLWFARYFLTVPRWKIPFRHRNVSSLYVGNYDRTNPLTASLVSLNMKRLSGKKESISTLMLPSLFSPPLAFISHNLVFSFVAAAVFLMGGYLYFSIRTLKSVSPLELLPLLLAMYTLSTGFTSLDFLLHRHRLPGLWMMSGIGPRKAFAHTIFKAYFKVAARQYLFTSITIGVLPLLNPNVYLFRLIPIMALGVPVSILVFSASLSFSDEVRTPECRGWMFTGVLGSTYLTLLLVGILRNSISDLPGTWNFCAVALVISLIALWRAYKQWLDTEMDFSGPQLFNPGV